MNAKSVTKTVTVAAVVLSAVAQVLRSTGQVPQADAADAASAALPALTPALDQLTAVITAIGAPLLLIFKSPVK